MGAVVVKRSLFPREEQSWHAAPDAMMSVRVFGDFFAGIMRCCAYCTHPPSSLAPFTLSLAPAFVAVAGNRGLLL